jgi:hypothetical protein
MQHVGADVESHLIYLCVHRMIYVTSTSTSSLSNCSDVNANEESTISDITQIIRNVDEAYARYKYTILSIFELYHVDMFVTQKIFAVIQLLHHDASTIFWSK